MYSRSTERGSRRIKLPPGYDGSAFRHDTGEVRPFVPEDTETKVHSPDGFSRTGTGAEIWPEDTKSLPRAENGSTGERESMSAQKGDNGSETGYEPSDIPAEQEAFLSTERESGWQDGHTRSGSSQQIQKLLEGLLSSLRGEDWLLVAVVLLLLADGSDAWDVILLLCLLLAVH